MTKRDVFHGGRRPKELKDFWRGVLVTLSTLIALALIAVTGGVVLL